MKNPISPFNDDIEKNPDKEYIGGQYSTFDIELSRLSQDTKASKTKIYIAARKKISKQKAKEFYDYVRSKFEGVINGDDEINNSLLNLKKLKFAEKISLAQKIIDTTTAIINGEKGDFIPNIPVKKNKKIGRMAICGLKNQLEINLFEKDYSNDMDWLVSDLFHEYIHIVDIYAPHISPLGAQISCISQKHYSNKPGKLHNMNPLEINAYGEYHKFK
ncbi:MAG: hypothetical protein FWE50_03380 [Alphaproteobacteria bacterium]|nr:hypothetical protein [Alphaproteobacteria bacterium]